MSDLVHTTTGDLRGVRADGVTSFKGIPYADSTAGEGRFRAARPPAPWAGVRDCSEYGPSCPQVSAGQVPAEYEQFMGIWAYERSIGEDCLVLNVWTPATGDDTTRPVLLFAHPGAWSIGSSSWPLYDFANLARRNDVVVVSVNHRIGILGFLDLSALDEDLADSGNLGILDLVAALEWVRDNVGGFGGDPANVTVFGESGGGSKTTCLLGTPAALGLFHGAFAMSGAFHEARERDAAQELTTSVLGHLGVGADLHALQSLDVDVFVRAELELGESFTRTPTFGQRRSGFTPVIAPSLPQHPIDAVRAGSAVGKRVVTGCTTHEMASFLATPDLWEADDAGVHARLVDMLGADADDVEAAYRAAHPDESAASRYLLIASDRFLRMPHIRFTEALLEGGTPDAWLYHFALGRPGPDGVMRSGHGSDMPYFFDNVATAPIADGPHAASLAAATSGALAALARHGDPGHAAIPAWPAYSLDERPTMVFDVETRLEHDPGGAERRAWDHHDVRRTSW